MLVGISGPSSSGKTTVARLIRDQLNSHEPFRALILHEDDFYKTDAEIPKNDEGLQDWDCVEAIDLPLFERVLAYVKSHGRPPTDFESKEDKNSVGRVSVSQKALQHCDADTAATAKQAHGPVTVVIVDGFLLYSADLAQVARHFDLKLFLRTTFATAKRRREARSGYVTLEGFWEDPPGYVEKIVWPNYVKDHKFLFENGDVDGELDKGVCDEWDIVGMPLDADGDMDKCLQWAHGQVCSLVRNNVEKRQ